MKGTTQKPHLDKISAAIMLKRAQKNISAQTVLTKQGYNRAHTEIHAPAHAPSLLLFAAREARKVNQTFRVAEFYHRRDTFCGSNPVFAVKKKIVPI